MKKRKASFIGLMSLVAPMMIMILTLTSGCGSQGSGYVTLEIEDADHLKNLPDLSAELSQASLSSDVLTIKTYRATISAEDMKSPLVAEVASTEKEITIKEVPYGDDRTILIEALNAQGTVLRRRKLEGVQLKKGVVSNVRGRLNTVPVALNLREGAFITASNFRIIGFGEAGSSVHIRSEGKEGIISFSESATLEASSMSVTPSLSSGIFKFSRKPLTLGPQTITLEDESTGETSSVNIIVLANQLPGRKLNVTSRAEPALSIGGYSGDTGGVHFPLVLETLYQSEFPIKNEKQ